MLDGFGEALATPWVLVTLVLSVAVALLARREDAASEGYTRPADFALGGFVGLGAMGATLTVVGACVVWLYVGGPVGEIWEDLAWLSCILPVDMALYYFRVFYFLMAYESRRLSPVERALAGPVALADIVAQAYHEVLIVRVIMRQTNHELTASAAVALYLGHLVCVTAYGFIDTMAANTDRCWETEVRRAQQAEGNRLEALREPRPEGAPVGVTDVAAAA